jgi:G3E family GTPase
MIMKRTVTILSGFLGSGKTTLLNQILKSANGLRIAVMINDFGDVNVDRDLVVGQSGDVVELSGGCMCCTTRDDLLGSAQELLRGGRAFDYLIVETSGLADPAIVARTFLVPGLEESFRLDAVVTVVDSANIESSLEQNETAREQIRCADLLVVNKLDLVTPEDMDRIESRLAEINAYARALPAINGIVPTGLLLGIDVHREAGVPDNDHHHHHAHHGELLSVSFADDIELDYDKFDRFVQNLPDAVYRAKGTIAIQGLSRRVIFHRVGCRNVLDQGAPWDDQQRSCRAVLLGKEFDGEGLLARLRDCAAPSRMMGSGHLDGVREGSIA